jgi:hypothetical protein
MRRLLFSPSERRWLLLSAAIPALLLGFGALYAWNNRVPDLVIPHATPPSPNAFDFFQEAAAAYVPARIGWRIDGHIDTTSRNTLPLFSAEYSRRYPLSRKLAYLKQNAKTLRLMRQGLKYSYLQPPERDAFTSDYYKSYRDIARLLLVESHARAQRGDWDGAADSLLDTIHFGNEVPRGGALIAGLVGVAIRATAVKDFKAILPHVSRNKARTAIHNMEKWQSQQVSFAQSLEEEKRAMQSNILTLIRSHDFRPLYVSFACLDGCSVSDAEYQQAMNELSVFLKMRLAWMNKPRVLREYTRCMNWQIAQARKPYPRRTKDWPFPESSDGVDNMVYPRFSRTRRSFARTDSQAAVLLTMLALRAFRLDNHRYPKQLSELVPKYLSLVPLDPFSNRQSLRYRLAPVRYITRTWGEPTTPSDIPAESARVFHRYKTMPFTLYSIGLNARDDGGSPYLSSNDIDHRRYVVDLSQPDTAKADIVAGIN